eukprot:GHUV01010131.1.p1 GENE.GHUV01010131.1~~GHUV01010131.1.p1  ORF type:complete len:188 (+),score=37.56 GHUV01010131.1:1603-2166(+)
MFSACGLAEVVRLVLEWYLPHLKHTVLRSLAEDCWDIVMAVAMASSIPAATANCSTRLPATQDVSQWLSPADLRRARLVCKPWLKALSTLGTKATTPPESSSVTKWKLQLEAMVAALPCLQEVTIGSKLSAVGAQQLSVLAAAEQLRVLNIPQGHAVQDRSLMVRWCPAVLSTLLPSGRRCAARHCL